MLHETFGQHIRRLRTELGFSVRHLAGLISVDPTYLSRVENDRFDAPGEDVLTRLAVALKQDPDVLLGVAGRVSKEIQEIIASQPQEFARLIRLLKGKPGAAIDGVAREVRDGNW